MTEWSLLPLVLEAICRKYSCPLVDLFDTRADAKLPLYVFPVPDPMASLNWRFEVFGSRGKLTRIQLTPSHLLHESCNVKGTGLLSWQHKRSLFVHFIFLLDTKLFPSSYCPSHATPSHGFHELQVHLYLS